MKQGRAASFPVPKSDSEMISWLASMHESYSRGGASNADELRRIIGDPFKSVELKCDDDAKTSSFLLLPK